MWLPGGCNAGEQVQQVGLTSYGYGAKGGDPKTEQSGLGE